MYFLSSVRTGTRLVHLKIQFRFYSFVYGLGGWFRVFWFSLHFFNLIFSFLFILVCGWHCLLVFVWKNKQTNKFALNFSHGILSCGLFFTLVYIFFTNKYILFFFSFLFFYLHRHHFIFLLMLLVII